MDEQEHHSRQLERWRQEADSGQADAAALLAQWHRRLELGPDEWSDRPRQASPDEAYWTRRMVELGSFPSAWQAVQWAVQDRDVQRAAYWTRTATTLQCAAAGNVVRAADDLFVPFAWDRAPDSFCADTTVMIQAENHDAAGAALGAAAFRMGLVNALGHEYADEREQEELEDRLPGEDDWQARTVSCIGGGGNHRWGPWTWIDGGIGGVSVAMLSTMLGILIEEVHRAGLSGAVLRSGRRADRGDHTPAHAVSTPHPSQVASDDGGADPSRRDRAVGDRLNAGEVLSVGASLMSANGRYTFTYRDDGNLVLEGPGGISWSSQTGGQPLGTCRMSDDGDLVLDVVVPSTDWSSRAPGTPGDHLIVAVDGDVAVYRLWASRTAGTAGNHLVVQDDGNVVVYRPDGTPAWSTRTWVFTGPLATGDGMRPGDTLTPGASITSTDGRHRLTYQSDGDLVLHGAAGVSWASGTAGGPAGVCFMQSDGNLVLYAPGGSALWASGTHRHPGSHLTLQNDGLAVISRPDGTAVWSSVTGRP
ncbi:hypothetical protein [Kineococcus glutinatus]|uniref:Bulb-type lectin domain-containing protein n=1 Tax=Kineococcus glutinatus TaxID=1070872 RepID=A0ABP9HQ30_9ACTN